MNKFTEEFINASFNTEQPRRNLHKSKEKRREIYNKNNARNRDVLTKQKASGKHIYLEDILNAHAECKEINKLDVKMDLQSMGLLDENGEITESALDMFNNLYNSDNNTRKRTNKRNKL